MIKKVELHNFLSYADVTVELEGATIAVTGDNGTGKSSFLEAIPYAYFGIGRETMEGMSRINGDGTHEVVIYEDTGVEVRRGRKKSGNGFFEVYQAGELLVKGKEADVWVERHLGMDGDTFMLTAFFGLQDVRHDTLIRVSPANRLEALQKLAEIGPYRKLLKEAKDEYTLAEKTKVSAESKKEGAEAAMVDEVATRALIESVEKAVESASKLQLDLKTKKNDLKVEESKYQAFLKEKSELTVERRTLDRDITSLVEELEDLKSVTDIAADTVKRSIHERDSMEVPKVDPEDLKSEIEYLDTLIGETLGRVNLLSTVVDSETPDNQCPLCHSPVADNQIDLWIDELKTLKITTVKLKSDKVGLKNINEEFVKTTTRMAELKRMIDGALADSTEGDKRKIEIEQELRKLHSVKAKKDSRFIDLQEKLGDEYHETQANIEAVDSQLDDASSEISAGNREVKLYKDRLKDNLSVKAKIREYEKEIKDSRIQMQAARLLTEAWSRYGIPMRLIKGTMAKIEEIATTVYQEFGSGRIAVSSVIDRGKQGVQFSLQDRKGSRTFNQLSAGEKVMFFISVRVAISQIIRESREVTVDYLILDEAMGYLSPKSRDNLIRLINKALRKMFPQVAMVSHTEMRDIFTTTLRVTSENGDSQVEVL